MKGDFARAADALARAFEHAGRAGNRHERFESLAVLGVIMLWGPTPADEGSGGWTRFARRSATTHR